MPGITRISWEVEEAFRNLAITADEEQPAGDVRINR